MKHGTRPEGMTMHVTSSVKVILKVGMLMIAIVGGAAAAGPVVLTEAELDSVTAGSASVSEAQELMRFDVIRHTQSGKVVAAEGDLLLLDPAAGVALGNSLVLDNAQNHLQSIININAVNSDVNVLLNMNISIDSRIDAVNQLNLNGVASGTRSGHIR